MNNIKIIPFSEEKKPVVRWVHDIAKITCPAFPFHVRLAAILTVIGSTDEGNVRGMVHTITKDKGYIRNGMVKEIAEQCEAIDGMVGKGCVLSDADLLSVLYSTLAGNSSGVRNILSKKNFIKVDHFRFVDDHYEARINIVDVEDAREWLLCNLEQYL